MSKLSIGLVTSPSEESDQLIKLLQELGIEITYHISPDEIESEHIQSESLNVWLLNVNDDDWHDNIDQLLDESEASIYFNEPGNLSKQSHPEYWCRNLVSRLYELTGIDESSEQEAAPSAAEEVSKEPVEQSQQQSSMDDDSLTSALDQLETSSAGIPSDIAADLVSELETISPELEASIEESSAIDEDLKRSSASFDNSQLEEIEISDIVEPEEVDIPEVEGAEIEAIAEEDLAAMAEVNSAVEEVELELESADLNLDDDDLNFDELDNIELSDELPSSLDSESDLQASFLDSSAQEQSQSEDSLELTLETPESQIEMLDDLPSGSTIEPQSEDLQQPEYNEIESETADISDEIMSLADSDSDSEQLDEHQPETHLSESNQAENESIPMYEEIDLSAEVNPVLESAREDFQQPSSSVFDTDDDEPSSSGATTDGKEAEEFFSNFESSPSQDLDADNSEIELSLADDGELDLTLDDAEAQLDFETELAPQSEQVEESTESQLSGLELEAIDQPAPAVTGKAVFIEEQEQQEEQPQQEESDELAYSDGGLTLESIGDEQKPVTGRAQFTIDDEPKDSDANEQACNSDSQEPSAVEEPSAIEEPLAVEEPSEQEQTVNELEISLEPVSNPTGEASVEDEITVTDDAAEFSETLIELDDELLEESEPESFEIPMLDDAATGLDFEEPVKPTIKQTELCPCWVIGASLGGPAAVKRFLQSLPSNINASFIITQHIDENFLPVLAEILTSSSEFEVTVANGSNSMAAGNIYLAPLNGKAIFLQDGSMLVDRSQKWSEPYSPCIDDVIESLSAVYKEKSGAIIFSGMGQDGLNGAKKMKALGGQIWAQSVDTCANPSMPDAVITEGLTDVVASPEMLAEQLANYLAS